MTKKEAPFRVLVVDDDLKAIELLKLFLES